MRWHHSCPNPRPAPCGGFIAGMNTVICRGRAAQLLGGEEAFWGPGVGGRHPWQHPSHCPPHSPPHHQLLLAPLPAPWCHLLRCPTGTFPATLQQPKALGAPAGAGSTPSTKPSSTPKAGSRPGGTPGALGTVAGGEVHTEPGTGLRLEKQQEAKRNPTALAQPEPAQRVPKICAKTKLKG